MADTILTRLKAVGGAANLPGDVTEFTLATYVGRIITVAISLIGIIFVAQIVYAGYLWMTATGEEEQVTKAKHIIRRSVIGLAIVLSAWAITSFVVKYLLDATT